MGNRYRLYPTPAQEAIMREHCAHARFVWNLAVEQQSWWRPGRGRAPGYPDQSRQLTDARSVFDWLRAGSRTVQEQALRDFEQAMQNFFRGTRGKPSWRKAGRREGFRMVGRCGIGKHFDWGLRRISRHVGEVKIPKVGWVRFRWSLAVPETKSYRVTLDSSGRWHVAFSGRQQEVSREPTGSRVGIDRGVRTTLVTSDGQHYRSPRMSGNASERHRALARRHSRQQKKSAKRERTRIAMARITVTAADRRKDWAEKISTRFVVANDVIVLEKLNINGLVRKPAPIPDPETPNGFLPNRATSKATLSRGILTSCWGILAKRIAQKAEASGVIAVQVKPNFTSQQCHACGHTAAGNRESQAVFRCQSCGHEDHADRNAARNILARGLLLTTGEIVPAHAPGHGVSRPQRTAKAAAGTTRSAA